MRISSPTAIKVENASDAGAYVIDTDNTTFDFFGSTISGASDGTPADQFVGRAIVIRKAKNVTLKNVKIRGFKVTIFAEDSPGLRLENCDVSNNYRMRLKSTPQREHNDDWLWPHKNDNGEWLRYGAGIYLLRCDNAKVMNCRARNGQNGICISRSNRVEVIENDMSFMSGWGLAMHRSNHCRVTGNRFDYCVRGYSHGVYNRGQDSAGILVFEQCSDNTFAFNSATHGGDGFFLYAGDETLKETGTGGCNRNVLYKNDFSYAVTNGIEATFSDQNVFVGNTLTNCDHGVWAGYSSRSLIAQNHIYDCNVGIALEHGRENRIEWNDFLRCKRGIWLWWDDDKDLLASKYAEKNGHASEGEQLRRNYFEHCSEGVLLAGSRNATVESSQWKDCKVNLLITDDASMKKMEENEMRGGVFENKTNTKIRALFTSGTFESKGLLQLSDPDIMCHEEVAGSRRTAPLANEHNSALAIPQISNDLAKSEKTLTRLVPIAPGDESIFMDEWGPYDFVEPRIFPSRFAGAAPLKINVLGPTTANYKVLPGIDPHFDATPPAGDVPGQLTIAARTGEHTPPPGAYPFELDIKIGDSKQRLTCIIIVAQWKVRYFSWTPERDPREGDEKWKKIIASAPIKTETRDNLDLPFGGGGPTADVKEHFALSADTRLTLPPGKWKLRTISDDGVRVFFDNKRVIDNWTWHVPTEDAATVDASTAGPHDIRVEYFEITGHAQLQVTLEPVE